MKFQTKFCLLFLLIILLDLSTPYAVDAQRYSERTKAISDAKRNAEASVNRTLWFFTGCIGNFMGIFAANTYHHPVPTVPLLGKSPEYVSYYTDTYISETRKLQSNSAFNGCIIGSVVQVCLPLGISIYRFTD